MTIAPDRLAQLDSIELKHGGHNPGSGCYCFNEAVAFVAQEPHSAAPACESDVLRRYTTVLNDRWNDEDRQLLKPFVPRVVGTAGDGKDDRRKEIATQFLLERYLEPWFRLAGMDTEADQVIAARTLPIAEQIQNLRRWRDAAWTLRDTRRAGLRSKIEAEITRILQEKREAAWAAEAAGAVDWSEVKKLDYYGQKAYFRKLLRPYIEKALGDEIEASVTDGLALLDAMLELKAA